MPDWSYGTVGRPLLFRLSSPTARRMVLEMLHHVARLPGGGWLIDLLGHMRPSLKLHHELRGVLFPGRVGLGTSIDPDLRAVKAFERFGFAYLEVGQHVATDSEDRIPASRDTERRSLMVPHRERTLDNEQLKTVLQDRRRPEVRIFLHVNHETTDDDFRHQIDVLGELLTGVVVPLASLEQLSEVCRCQAPHLMVLGQVPVSALGAEQVRLRQFDEVDALDGLVLDGSSYAANGGRVLGPSDLAATVTATRRCRGEFGPDMLIVSSGGLHEPVDAVTLLDAGADLVTIDSGLVYAGPGLAKRANEAVLHKMFGDRCPSPTFSSQASDPPPVRQTWFWTLALGLSMLLGGGLAMIIALTRVVLPYDEALVGMTRVELAIVNDRLLDFMKHDRITLAGTMLCVGGLYTALSLFGVRRGMHWAGRTVVTSAFAGFVTFFLFLGFGYFDPFHAFVTAILFQFLLLAVYSHDTTYGHPGVADLHNDRAWRRALWGQLLFVIHGAVLIVAGLVICKIGVTSVFVAEDMEFMCTTPEKLLEANPQLVPLVAHDRATFGGMLISTGIAVLLIAMWGFRRGAAWIWWALLVCGSVAYLATIAIHLQVGYTSLKHLLPAYGGLAMLGIGAWLCRPFLGTSTRPP